MLEDYWYVCSVASIQRLLYEPARGRIMTVYFKTRYASSVFSIAPPNILFFSPVNCGRFFFLFFFFRISSGDVQISIRCDREMYTHYCHDNRFLLSFVARDLAFLSYCNLHIARRYC